MQNEKFVVAPIWLTDYGPVVVAQGMVYPSVVYGMRIPGKGLLYHHHFVIVLDWVGVRCDLVFVHHVPPPVVLPRERLATLS